MRDSWSNTRNVLCVRLDEMGDLLMTTPALRALKSAGGRRITVLTSRGAAAIASCIPEIDDVFVHQAPWVKSASPKGEGRGELEMAARLRQRNFDAAVIFTVFSQSPLPAAYLCYLADIPRRAAHCRENPYQLLTHRQEEIDEPPHCVRHEVRRQLDLVGALGFPTNDERLSLEVPDHARQAAAHVTKALGLDGVPWVLIHPGASASSRRYPPEHFAVAADLLAGEGRRILFTGGSEDVHLVESVRGRMAHSSASLAGRLSLEDLLGVIQRAPVVITNNTGPAHVAAALGTPVVVAYAQTNLQHTPWTAASRVLWHDVPCKFCLKSICPEGHHNCLRLVRPESVASAALELLTSREADDRLVARLPPTGTQAALAADAPLQARIGRGSLSRRRQRSLW
jgi:lipopolysaccharide heptosyltransferase II